MDASPVVGPPIQEQLPLAFVEGEAITELPQDLYIPPDALEIFLETFEGPLDLLLYLIKRQNLDILNIPIAEITIQYLKYIELMRQMQLDLAAEYLVMAALLLEIKSRMLLPRPEEEGEEEGDPRARLVQQLQEYARIKKAAQELNELPRVGRDTFLVEAEMPDFPHIRIPPKVPLEDLLSAAQSVLLRVELASSHRILREPLSVRERMAMILDWLSKHPRLSFQALFTAEEGRAGAVVALLAILELGREALAEIIQKQPFSPLEVQRKQ